MLVGLASMYGADAAVVRGSARSRGIHAAFVEPLCTAEKTSAKALRGSFVIDGALRTLDELHPLLALASRTQPCRRTYPFPPSFHSSSWIVQLFSVWRLVLSSVIRHNSCVFRAWRLPPILEVREGIRQVL